MTRVARGRFDPRAQQPSGSRPLFPVRETAGKCVKCEVVYRWRGAPLLRLAFCPEDGTQLKATNSMNHWPVQYRRPAEQGAMQGVR